MSDLNPPSHTRPGGPPVRGATAKRDARAFPGASPTSRNCGFSGFTLKSPPMIRSRLQASCALGWRDSPLPSIVADGRRDRARRNERRRVRSVRPRARQSCRADNSAGHSAARRRRRRAHDARCRRGAGARGRAGAGRLGRRPAASELQAIGGVLLPFPAATKNPLAMLLNVRKLARLIIAERVDLVHARSRAPAWVALGACRIAERPFVTTYHGAYAGRSALKLRYNSVMARGDVGDRQFAIHRGHDRATLSRGPRPAARHPSRHGSCGRFRRRRSIPRASRGCARPGGSRRTSASCCSRRG